jgi:hypothetical protein
MLISLWGCQSTQLSVEERERRKQEERALKERYLNRIQSVETSVYESMEVLAPKVADYNRDELYGYSGAVFVTDLFYPFELSGVARERGFGSQVVVRHVFEGSPADGAGLLLGDQLIRLNGKRVPRGEQGASFIVGKLKKLWLLDEPNTVVVNRNGRELSFEISAENSVYYSILVTPYLGGEEPAYAEGKAIYFSLEGLEGLEEAQFHYVCAYALVQNVMKHAKMKGQNELLGGVIDVAAMLYGVNTGGVFGNLGRNAQKAGFLIESDLLALYALASAGIDINDYPAFWEERLRDRNGQLSRVNQDRLDAMRQVISEIEVKRQAGEAIYPTEYLSGEWKLDDWRNQLESSDSALEDA